MTRLQWSSSAKQGFTRVELFVVVVVIGVLLGLMFLSHTTGRAKVRVHPIRCIANLKQVGLGFRIWANEHDDRYPFWFTNSVEPYTGTQLYKNTTSARAWMHFQVLSNELQNARVITCPQDSTRSNASAEDFQNGPLSLSATNNRDLAVSYFIGLEADEARPQAILAGDRNLAMSRWAPPFTSTKHGALKVPPHHAWWSQADGHNLHTNFGHFVMADGSVQKLTVEQLRKALQTSEAAYGTNANLFLFPQ